MILGTVVSSEGFLIEHKQAVPHSVCVCVCVCVCVYRMVFQSWNNWEKIVSTKIVTQNSDIVDMYL
jgi:hypothetical protein